MKKLFLTSTLCLGVLFNSICLYNNLNHTCEPKTDMVPYQPKGALAMEGRVKKTIVYKIKLSERVIEELNNGSI